MAARASPAWSWATPAQPASTERKAEDLHALATQDPGTEVPTVVRQQSIATFAQAGTRTRHCFAAIERRRVVSNPNAAASSEMLERNFLHRSAPKSVCEAGVVDDVTAADVYAVMAVQCARSDKVGGEWRFLAGTK